MGYPGAGKTTVAKIIHDATGARHLWADNIRWQMFSEPRHTPSESHKLYTYLNNLTAELLKNGTSVIFDTNFNFKSDRDHLRRIAAETGAKCLLIWLTTPLDVAKSRAVHSQTTRNNYTVNMSEDMFNNIASKLEEPHEDENPLKIDGTKLDHTALEAHFKQYEHPVSQKN